MIRIFIFTESQFILKIKGFTQILCKVNALSMPESNQEVFRGINLICVVDCNSCIHVKVEFYCFL